MYKIFNKCAVFINVVGPVFFFIAFLVGFGSGICVWGECGFGASSTMAFMMTFITAPFQIFSIFSPFIWLVLFIFLIDSNSKRLDKLMAGEKLNFRDSFFFYSLFAMKLYLWIVALSFIVYFFTE